MAPFCHDHSPDSFNVRPFYAAAVENGITGCAAAINYKMFLDCAAALSSKKADENPAVTGGHIVGRSACVPGCGGAVLAAVSLSGLQLT